MTKRIVLCADDYGQAPGISQGILALIKQQRLSATSCMANSDYWLEHANLLIPFASQIDVGLHFNLTEGQAVSKQYIELYGENLPTLSLVMRKAFLRQWDQTVIEQECEAQIDRFTRAMGALPRFIDGHQHVHQFPVIREAVLAVYERRLRSAQAYVRLADSAISPVDVIENKKKFIIKLTGGYVLRQRLKAMDIPHNPSFSGIYSFSPSSQYHQLFPRFLAESVDGGLIMCHPGLESAPGDVIADARNKEYSYFASSQFLTDCHKAEVELSIFS